MSENRSVQGLVGSKPQLPATDQASQQDTVSLDQIDASQFIAWEEKSAHKEHPLQDQRHSFSHDVNSLVHLAHNQML